MPDQAANPRMPGREHGSAEDPTFKTVGQQFVRQRPTSLGQERQLVPGRDRETTGVEMARLTRRVPSDRDAVGAGAGRGRDVHSQSPVRPSGSVIRRPLPNPRQRKTVSASVS